MKKEKPVYFCMTCFWTVIIVLIFVVSFAYFGGMFEEKFDPEKDVCLKWNVVRGGDTYIHGATEEFADSEIESYPEEHLTKYCAEWRPKTKCQRDPNAEGCVCDEEVDTDKVIGGFACPGSCQTDEVRRCRVRGVYSYGREIDVWGISYKPGYCELDMYLQDPPITALGNYSMELYNENITQCEQCYEYEKTCIRAHEPNKCEKGNPDYTDGSEIVCGLDCTKGDKSGDGMILVPGECVEGCWDLKGICRQKTECQKGNPDWILESSYHNGECLESEIIEVAGVIAVVNENEYFRKSVSYGKSSNMTLCKRYEQIEEKTCRQKTFQDLTCEELKGEYSHPRVWCDLEPSPPGTWTLRASNIIECPPEKVRRYGTKEEILLEFIERCGGKS